MYMHTHTCLYDAKVEVKLWRRTKGAMGRERAEEGRMGEWGGGNMLNVQSMLYENFKNCIELTSVELFFVCMCMQCTCVCVRACIVEHYIQVCEANNERK